MVNTTRQELLWQRLEHAKLQVDHCHNYIREISHDKASGALPIADGNLARRHALRAEELAVDSYVTALNDFKLALLPPPAGAEGGHALTPREREVLSLVAAGKSSKEIAWKLGVAFKTVTTHRYRLEKKLEVHNTADLVRIAIRMGVVEP